MQTKDTSVIQGYSVYSQPCNIFFIVKNFKWTFYCWVPWQKFMEVGSVVRIWMRKLISWWQFGVLVFSCHFLLGLFLDVHELIDSIFQKYIGHFKKNHTVEQCILTRSFKKAQYTILYLSWMHIWHGSAGVCSARFHQKSRLRHWWVSETTKE